MVEYQIITNNPKVRRDYSSYCKLEYHKVSCMEIFVVVRNLVHRGHILLTNPMAGSIKPNQNPIRTVVVSLKPQDKVEQESEDIINNCMIACRKFLPLNIPWPAKFINDFIDIDYALVGYILDEIRAGRREGF